jgi:DNA-binding HxlR family transcriptional regulator
MSARPNLDAFDGCALPAALNMMGERWSFLILRAAFNGYRHFEDFQATLGIARNILANRLARLVEHGILSREASADDRRRVIYTLTEKGEGLVPVMIALRQWGERWGDGSANSPILCDRRDGLPVRPVVIQAADGRPLSLADLCWVMPASDDTNNQQSREG